MYSMMYSTLSRGSKLTEVCSCLGKNCFFQKVGFESFLGNSLFISMRELVIMQIEAAWINSI